MPMLDRSQRRLITSARTLGGERPTRLEDAELIRLCFVIASDLARQDLAPDLQDSEGISPDYYHVPLSWFLLPVFDAIKLVDVFLRLDHEIEDFPEYFENLCEIHKRRRKFASILETKTFSAMEQVVPKSLLEYGLWPSEALASWLVWRKWLFDIDNRAAQEAGYLFEPILATALGGIRPSLSASPIFRTTSAQAINGTLDEALSGESMQMESNADATDAAPTSAPQVIGSRRQVDCIVDSGDEKLAYEFKTRITNASSYQGRFPEELSFAQDCRYSGFTPVLLVLAPTNSGQMVALRTEYERQGGKAYAGTEAWDYIEAKAGDVLGQFIQKYVKLPFEDVEHSYTTLLPLNMSLDSSGIRITVGSEVIIISRSTGQQLSQA